MLDVSVRDFGHPDDPIRATHPVLAGFLFKKSWNGYEPRESAVLTLTITPIGVTFSFKMPSEAQNCSDDVSYVGDVLDRLELCLRTRKGRWKELKSGPGATFLREQRKKERAIRKARK